MIRISRITRPSAQQIARAYVTSPNPHSSLPESFADPPKEEIRSKSTFDNKTTTKIPQAPSNPSPFYRPEPPFVAAARAKTVKNRNVFESYLVLDPKVRLYFSLGLMVFAGIGLYAGDIIVPLTEEEKEANELAK